MMSETTSLSYPSDELEAIDLSDAERSFIYFALTHWGGPASYKPLPINDLFGISDWTEFDALTARLAQASTDQQPLPAREWALALFLTELSFASDLVGTGVEFALISHSDEDGISLLRSIQRKISSSHPRRPAVSRCWPPAHGFRLRNLEAAIHPAALTHTSLRTTGTLQAAPAAALDNTVSSKSNCRYFTCNDWESAGITSLIPDLSGAKSAGPQRKTSSERQRREGPSSNPWSGSTGLRLGAPNHEL